MAHSSEDLARIASFADALPVAIWVGRAPSGECVYVNREFEAILGITPPQTGRGNYVGPYGVHLPSGEPYPEDQMPFERAMRARGTVVVDDIVIHRHDGGRPRLRVFVCPLFDDAGEISYIVEAFTDISREVEAERQRAEGVRQLHAIQRMSFASSLAGGVAHDFNNLLAIVKLVSSQLRLDETDAGRLDLLRNLDEVADSAAKLTRALLGLAGRGKHLSQPLSVHDVVQSVVSLSRRTFNRRINIVEALEAQAATVTGDAGQIEQVVMNLLLNARDALPDGGEIIVRTSNRAVVNDPEGPTGGLAPGNYVVLDVIDNGGGIDPLVRERVFEPYVSSKDAGAAKGTGLGLATVFGVAQNHSGTAEVAATGPEGTTMRVWLPETQAVVAIAPLTTAADASRGQGTVLVVDDEPLVLRCVALTLESLGYRALTAADGRSAVAIYESQRERVDAVVLDMVMPGMNGRETYLALREVDPAVPVLLTSGFALDEEAQKILDLGVRGFIGKPFDRVALSTHLMQVLQKAS